MSYIDLRGHQVWSVIHENNGEPVLLMHGGLSSTEDWDFTVLPAIASDYHVYSYDRSAHGRTKIRDGYFHFDFQTDEAIAYIEDVIKGPTHLIGWSDGGIISLLIALKRPDLVKSIIAIGPNYNHDSGLSFNLSTVQVPDEDKALFAERSGQDPELLVDIVTKAFQVWATEPNMTLEQLSKIEVPVLILAGDDEPFGSAHTFEMYEAFPNGRLAVLPGASHYVVKEQAELMQSVIRDFYIKPEFPITKYANRRNARQREILGNS